MTEAGEVLRLRVAEKEMNKPTQITKKFFFDQLFKNLGLKKIMLLLTSF
jgi:hypothetical protein